MDNLLSFYNTLLGIEVSVIGVIIAVIFVFIQLVYSKFSHREVKYIIFDKYLILFLLLGAITIVFTCIGSLSLSLQSHDFIKSVDLGIKFWVTNPNSIVGILLLLGATSLAFFLLVLSNLKYLQPSRLIYLATKTWNISDAKRFLHKKYGIPEPFENVSILYTLDDPKVEEVRKEIEAEIEADIKSEGNSKSHQFKEKSQTRKELEAKVERQHEQYKKDVEQQQLLEKRVANTKDPFADANQIALDAIAKLDLRTYQIFLSDAEKFGLSFIKTIQSVDGHKLWNPEKNLAENLIRQLVEMYKSHLEIIDRQGLFSLRLAILDSTNKIALDLVENKDDRALTALTSFWKRMTDSYMIAQQEIFKRVVKNLQNVTDAIMEQGRDERILEEMFRDIGWVGEKLFIHQSFQEEPLMPDDHDQSSQFDDLMNAILHFETSYGNSHPTWYPLVYFDAVDVIFLRLVEAIKNGQVKIKNADNSLFNLFYVYFSFAKSAILVNNGSGAELAARSLSSAIKELNKSQLEKKRNEAIDLLLDLGAFGAGHKDSFKPAGLLDKPFDDWVIDEIMPYMAGHDISSEILEIYIKGEGNKKAIKGYIVKLADRTGRSFRLNIEVMRADVQSSN